MTPADRQPDQDDVAERMTALRQIREQLVPLDAEVVSLRECRDALALGLVEDGVTWREVADAAGFKNPYLARLKAKRDAA